MGECSSAGDSRPLRATGVVGWVECSRGLSKQEEKGRERKLTCMAHGSAGLVKVGGEVAGEWKPPGDS